MRDLSVLAVPAGDDASAWLRMRWPAQALAAHGCDVRIAHPEWRLMILADDDTGQPVRLWSSLDCDVIVLQRLALGAYVRALPLIQRAGIAVVIDVDDDFARIDPANGAYASYHPRTSPDSNFQHLARGCELADLVTVSTPALAKRYAPHGRVRVVPNRVPRRALDVPAAANTPPVVGWAGALSTHPRDLQITRGAIARAVRDSGARFLHVGPNEGPNAGVARALGFDHVESTGFVAHADWYETIARLDISIGPLAVTQFNQAKSGLRGLEAASVASAPIVTPTEDYVRLARDGVCVLAESPREWYRMVRRFVEDSERRENVRADARAAARRHVLEDHAGEWWDAWTEARAWRQKRGEQ